MVHAERRGRLVYELNGNAGQGRFALGGSGSWRSQSWDGPGQGGMKRKVGGYAGGEKNVRGGCR